MNRMGVALLSLLWVLTPPAYAASDAPFLYEIQGAKARHYLMGSVHLLPASSQPLPAALEGAYAKASGVTFESDLASLADPKTQMVMLNAATADKGLQSVVSKETWERLQKRAKAMEMPVEQVCAPYKAWFCAMTLEVFSFQREGFDAEYGLDQYFFNRALNDGKAIHWLEEPEAHLAIFTQMPDKLSEQFLIATLDEQTESGQEPEALLRMWRDGDKTELEKLTREMKARHPQAYARLLADRSHAWMPKLEKLLASDSSQLIIVGAAHLAGSDGLPALLKAKGYDIRPAGGEALKAAARPRDPRPAGAPWAMLYLNAHDADAAYAFYQSAFGFEPGAQIRDARGRLTHGELKYHDAVIMLGPEEARRPAPATGKFAAPSYLYLYVDDIDALTARAKKAGAEIVQAPADQFWGDRTAMLRDSDGYLWTWATHLPDASAAALSGHRP